MEEQAEVAALKEACEPTYFYRVYENICPLDGEDYLSEAVEQEVDFKAHNLLAQRAEAIDWYTERLKTISPIKNCLPTVSHLNFRIGEKSRYIITLSIVEFYNDEEYYEHIILGEEDHINIRGLCIENTILSEFISKRRPY